MTEPTPQTAIETADVDRQAVAEVYAKALWGVARKSGNEQEILEQLDAWVDDVLARNPKIRAVLESPRIANNDKERLLDQALEGRASAEFLNFLKVLVRHNRMDTVIHVRPALRRLYNEMHQRLDAVVTTAEPMDEATSQRVAQQLSQRFGKQVQLQPRVDPAIIGGLVVRVGDTVYDSSLRTQLQQMRRRALQRTVDAIRNQPQLFATETNA